jgi:hypothetical protein
VTILYQKVNVFSSRFRLFLFDIALRLLIPQNEGESHPIELFDVFVSDVVVLLVSKLEGKVYRHALGTSMLMVSSRMKW